MGFNDIKKSRTIPLGFKNMTIKEMKHFLPFKIKKQNQNLLIFIVP